MRSRMLVRFWCENDRIRDQYENIEAGVKIMLKWMSEKQGVVSWAVFMWLRVGTNSGLL
jgi:hypothetical protein